MIVVLLLVCCMTFAACQLTPSGANVCSKSVAYNTYQSRCLYRVSYQNYRTKTGWFGWSRKSVYRSYTNSYYEQHLVTAYKNTYVCCSGWSKSGNQCSIPICASGCGNGTCISPNNCRCYHGYQGDKCQYDVDECSKPCNQKCTNLPGTYACTCRNGFTKTHPDDATDKFCTRKNKKPRPGRRNATNV